MQLLKVILVVFFLATLIFCCNLPYDDFFIELEEKVAADNLKRFDKDKSLQKSTKTKIANVDIVGGNNGNENGEQVSSLNGNEHQGNSLNGNGEQVSSLNGNGHQGNSLNGNGCQGNSLSNFTSFHDLAIHGVTMPDSVVLNSMMQVTGYLRNNGNGVILGSLDLLFAVKEGLDESVFESVSNFQEPGPPFDVLQPNQSLYFEKEVLVTESLFRVNDKNIVIIWPDESIDNGADINLENNYSVNEVHVRL